MRCRRCEGKMIIAHSVLDGAPYDYYRCPKCGDEILDMKQLGEFGERHKKIRQARDVKFATWGNSIGVRIPKEMAKELKIVSGTPARLMVENGGIKIVKA